MKKPTIRKDNI